MNVFIVFNNSMDNGREQRTFEQKNWEKIYISYAADLRQQHKEDKRDE